MGVLRIERKAPTTITAKVTGVAWRSFDIQLFVYAGLLATLGLTMAYSNSTGAPGASADALQAGTTFARGVMWAVIAFAAFAAFAAFDYTWLRSFAWPLYLANLGLLVATLVLGAGDAGATSARWISILGFQFQFSELAKIFMILVLARYLGDRERKLDTLSSILGACLIVGPPWVLVMLQPDLGTSLCLLAILVGILFMAGASLRWMGVIAAGALVSLPIILSMLREYQVRRLTCFWDPSVDPLGECFQQLAAQKVVSTGGLIGAGISKGVDDSSNLLPVQTTDMVFAKLAQELGFVGSVVVFLLFAALLWRVMTIAWRSREPFGLLVGCGLASVILFQLLENVGMVLGVMPVTGIPLPFITHGGASLVSVGIGLGIMESIAMRQQRAEW